MMPADDVTDVELAFPAKGVERLPAWDDIPEDYRAERNPRCHFVQEWFMLGLKNPNIVPKEGVDKEKALRHIHAIMGSYGPKHEHKIAGVAYLIDQWFEKFEGEAIRG